MDQVGFCLPAEMLEVYKIQVTNKMQQGATSVDVPCELLLALIERSQVWFRLEADERQFQQEKST
jgi:hypothetical protein